MERESVSLKTIEGIIGEPVQDVQKITYGYTNSISSINDKYILKICTNERNLTNFRRASLFCQKYYGKINCPRIIYSCLEQEKGNMWQIEEKAKGQNLFIKWASMSGKEREDAIEQICDGLRRIHQIPILDVFERNFEREDWKNKFNSDIVKKTESLEKKGLLFGDLGNKIKVFTSQSLDALDETQFRICHTDMHFDNVVIDDENNITILDYDRLRIASLDYELNIFNIMQNHPELVVHNDMKKIIEQKDYKNILGMFQKKYKEMFEFSNLDDRLNVYALKHYLGLLGVVEEKNAVIDILTEIVNSRYTIKNERDELEIE